MDKRQQPHHPNSVVDLHTAKPETSSIDDSMQVRSSGLATPVASLKYPIWNTICIGHAVSDLRVPDRRTVSPEPRAESIYRAFNHDVTM